jgi:putative peptide zinc metalloprotease protein
VGASGIAAQPANAWVYAGDSQGNNIVQVQNTKDNATKAFSLAAVTHNGGSTVANENEAYAHATGTGNRTVATAIQVLIVEGDPTNFQPTNVAFAVNEQCSSCQTFAYANQVVLQPHRAVTLSEDSQKQLNRLNAQAFATSWSSEPFPQMSADLDNITNQMVAIVQGEIQRSGSPAAEQDTRTTDQR